MSFNKTPRGPTELATTQERWETAGTITVANATFGVTARDAATVDAIAIANKAVFEMPPHGNVLELRFQTTAAGNSHIIEMWVARGPADHYDRAVIFTTVTGGTQKADGAVFFVDTLAVTETFNNAGNLVNESAANTISRYLLDMDGYPNIVFIATTLQGSTTLTIQTTVH